GGGSKTTTRTTTYSYYGTFAVEICANEIIGISKMWLNSKLFYENRPFLLGTPREASDKAQTFFTIYNGSEWQGQDPTLIEAFGVELTPAYRNRAIIVFKDLPLEEFGNRLPVVEVIAHQGGSGSNLGTIAPAPTKLHKVVGDLCQKVGLSEEDIDLTELTDDVEGFQLSQRGNVQGFLRELQQVYHFGCIDTGKKLRFVSHPVPVMRDEYRQNCLINEDYLITNSFHDILGRQGYFPSSSGTSEGQFAQIIAALRAYQATSDSYWLSLAESMAGALSKLYFAEPPADPATLYTPHWLFNVKRPVQLQSSVLTAKVWMTRQGDGTYTGLIPSGHGYFGELVTQVTRVYDNVSGYLVWNNPYSGVRGTSYPLPIAATTNSSGTYLTFGVNAFGTVSGVMVNLAYIVNAGKMLGVSEMMEAWPHWREIEAGEIDCAVDTLAWALEAFDLLYAITSNAKWLKALNATASNIHTVYAVDDGRWWMKRAKGSPFVLSGTYLVAEEAPFTEAQISRNNALQLVFGVTADPVTLAGVLANPSPGSLIQSEIQYGRGINDAVKAGDTHIRFKASCSVPGTKVTVFLQDRDDDLLSAFRWVATVTLSASMADYNVARASFSKRAYPFQPADQVSTGLATGQVLRVAGIIFQPTQAYKLTVESLRPIPEVQLPYTPAIAPYTANSVGGQLLDWAGGPGIGYQNAYVWARLGDAGKRNTMLQFLADSQAAYTGLFGVVGPFVPAYVWDRYDVLEIAGTPGTWQWNWPDPNSEWCGYVGRCIEGIARCYQMTGHTTARDLCANYLTWLNTYWTTPTQYIPTNYPASIPARANSTYYGGNALVQPAGGNGRVYRSNNAGTSAGSAPSFPTTIGATVTDSGIVWRCVGYKYGPSPVYGEYNEPHTAALTLRAAAWYRLGGGNTALADAIVARCWAYMENIHVSTGEMAGTWSPNPGAQEWWGFWGAEIVTTLSLLLTEHNAVRAANGISTVTINERIAGYKVWLAAHTRSIEIPKIEDVITDVDYSITTTQDVELPNEVIIKYSNIRNSGEAEARYTRKQSGMSDASVNLSLNMAIPGQEAATLTQTILNAFWSQRDEYSMKMQSLLIQPMDCVEYDVDGSIKRLIVDSTLLDLHHEVQVSAKSYDPTSYRISSPAASESVSNVVSLSFPPPTAVEILNLPAINDDDNQPGYASGARAANARWRGGSLSVSNGDGLPFAFEAAYSVLMTRGTVAETLPANKTTVIDRATTLTVTLEYGEIESITLVELLAGGNLALLGNEVINFQNAELIGAGTYLISGFLRGQRGTEDQVYSHGAGDRFILLNEAIERSAITASVIGLSRQARVYSYGRPDEDFDTLAFIATAENMKPWAPVNIVGWRNGDNSINLRWTRRSRIDNSWRDSVDIGLGEDVERYQIDLLTAPLYLSGTVLRSITLDNTQETIVSAADLTAAYGSSSATTYISIRQVSLLVGAGKPLEGTF
ncbi:MAG: phage tail protein, partial [Saprospiraceae bacterium]|nr:phage tail protein [Saprospiraceae bacterium]